MGRKHNELVAINISEHGTVTDVTWRDVTGKKQLYLSELRRNGGNKPAACKRVGIAWKTLIDWRYQDPEFKADERDAVIEATGAYQKKIHDRAIKGDLKASIFLLEKMNPEFHPRQQVEVEVQHRVERPSFARNQRLDDLPIWEVDDAPTDENQAGPSPIEVAYREVRPEEAATAGLWRAGDGDADGIPDAAADSPDADPAADGRS